MGITSFSHYRILIIFPYFLTRHFSYALGFIPFSSRACCTLVCMSGFVAVDDMGIISTVGVSDFFSPHCKVLMAFASTFQAD